VVAVDSPVKVVAATAKTAAARKSSVGLMAILLLLFPLHVCTEPKINCKI
jgi:hypothetical protein